MEKTAMRTLTPVVWLSFWMSLNASAGPATKGQDHPTPVHGKLGPNVQFEQLTIEHGLPSNTVYRILQDSLGFLWFGTRDGLARYDGNTFRVYRYDPADPASISDNWITAIFEDSFHVLWIGTRRGLNKFNPSTEEFTRYLPDPNDPNSLSAPIVADITESSYGGRGTLWIGIELDEGGLFQFDRETERFRRHGYDPKDPDQAGWNHVRCLVEDDTGRLWIGTQQKGIARFDPETATFAHYPPNPTKPNGLGHPSFWYGMKDRAGNLWFSSFGGGVHRYDPGTDGFIRYQKDSRNLNSLYWNQVHDIFQDDSGKIWIGNAVLTEFDPEIGSFTHLRFSPSQTSAASNYVPFAIHEDRSHNLWVGTRGRGVFKIDLKPKRFAHYAQDAERPNSVSSNEVRFLLEDSRGMIWVGTEEDGLNRFDPRTDEFTVFKHHARDPGSLSDNRVRAIHEDHLGTIWVGTTRGLNKLNSTGDRFVRYLHDPKDPFSLGGDQVNTIHEDRSGSLWMGGGEEGGLSKLDRETERFLNFKNPPESDLSGFNSVVGIHEDRFGNFWVSMVFLYLFDRHSKTFTKVLGSSGETVSPGSGLFESEDGTLWAPGQLTRVGRPGGGFKRFPIRRRDGRAGDDVYGFYSFYEDSNGMLWCGSTSGLLKFDPRKEEYVAHYTEKDGLLNNIVYKMLADDQGNLWLMTPVGISVFNEARPSGERFRNIGVHQGAVNFSTVMFNDTYRTFIKSRDGEIYWGATDGLYRFFPDLEATNETAPPVHLTEFMVFNQTAKLDRAISHSQTIRLAHHQNFFSFEFAALDFTNPKQNQYAYKLEGFDRDWVQAGNKPEASYTNVPPGSYRFRVKGANNDGIWNEEGASVELVIHPPYWATWWFRGFAVTVVIGLLVWLYNYRVSNLLEVERTRNRIARDLHDDVGSGLSTIALTAELLQNELARDPLVRRRLSRVHATAEKLGRNLKEIVWAVDPQKDKLDHLLLHMKEAASELLSQKGIRYRLDFPQEEMPQTLKMDFRRNLFLVYKEMLHNVVKHAGASQVKVAFSKSNGILRLEVQDDGKGFSPETVRPGTGLESMRSRAAELDGVLELESGPERGTTVRLSVRIP